MKILSFIGCLFLVAGYAAVAQCDSLTLVSANWQRIPISAGVTWESCHFQEKELFGSNQLINLIEILPGRHSVRLSLAYSDSLEKTSQLARKKKALAAINGSFFKMRGPDPDNHPTLTAVPYSSPSRAERNRSVVYLRVNDSLISENIRNKDLIRRRHQQGAISIDGRDVLVLKADPSDLNWETKLGGRDVMISGPVIRISSKDTELPDDAFCNDRHPRSAVGKRPDGTLILLVADGRHAAANGMTMKELQKTLRWLGCTDAINLDGGGSSTMYIGGQPSGGVVNYPSDNKKFDHHGEREVANAILVLPE